MEALEPTPGQCHPSSPSPVSVTHDPIVSHPVAPPKALCMRQPFTQAKSRACIVDAMLMLHDAYLRLTRNMVFMTSDLEIAPVKHTNHYASHLPELDPMGVLFSSFTLARYALDESVLQTDGLTFNMRCSLAAILFVVYKIRSEASFERQHCTSAHVLELFLEKSEIKMLVPTDGQNIVAVYERIIVRKYPLLRLVDETPHSSFEFEVWNRYANAEVPISAEEFKLSLASGFFWFFCATTNRESSVLEALGMMLTTHEIGRAIAAIAVSAACYHARRVHRPTAPPDGFTFPEIYAAARLLQNARSVVAGPDFKGYVGVYARSSTNPIAQLVTPACIEALCGIFS